MFSENKNINCFNNKNGIIYNQTKCENGYSLKFCLSFESNKLPPMTFQHMQILTYDTNVNISNTIAQIKNYRTDKNKAFVDAYYIYIENFRNDVDLSKIIFNDGNPFKCLVQLTKEGGLRVIVNS